jgi:hypothetical protein
VTRVDFLVALRTRRDRLADEFRRALETGAYLDDIRADLRHAERAYHEALMGGGK